MIVPAATLVDPNQKTKPLGLWRAVPSTSEPILVPAWYLRESISIEAATRRKSLGRAKLTPLVKAERRAVLLADLIASGDPAWWKAATDIELYGFKLHYRDTKRHRRLSPEAEGGWLARELSQKSDL